MSAEPLVVDLDGTLIYTDMLHESTLGLIRERPLDLLKLPLWLKKGKAVLKEQLTSNFHFDAETLPYNEELILWLKKQRNEGRKLILCTATDQSIANKIAAHLNIFDEVIASDGITNLAGANKAKKLEDRFGNGGFDYAGNSEADLTVWQSARNIIVVNATKEIEQKAKKIGYVEQVFSPLKIGISAWRKGLRVHQWLKNVLLFVPLLAAHDIANMHGWFSLIVAFISFSLCASSVYIANDLLDLESDRLHPRKRKRPFASGLIPVYMGVILAPLLVISSLILAAFVGGHFLAVLVIYFIITCVYSFKLKKLLLIDCLTLAILYTIRIIAGAAAMDNKLSFWLLAFSVFLFLSLAFVKRYAELEIQVLSGKSKIHGRGYHTSDASLIQTMGVVSGYIAVLVLALYLNSDIVIKLYKTPEVIWAAVPIMIFWISWIWMQAHRGKMHDDPVVFAIKDRASLAAGLILSIVLVIGSVGWIW